MPCQPYVQLVVYKKWADRVLYDLVAETLASLPAEDAAIMVRILDHVHAVDRIFQHHLQGLPHAWRAPQSETVPGLPALANDASEVADWYEHYVRGLSDADFEQPVDFVFTSGAPGRMRRREIILHVCLHGTYHRGNAGILLQKNGIAPARDGIPAFLAAA
jgi:uncharacterized damage-inducible protein DinB